MKGIQVSVPPKDTPGLLKGWAFPFVERHAMSEKCLKPKNPVKTQKKPSFTWNFTQNRVINCKKAHDAISEEKARRLP